LEPGREVWVHAGKQAPTSADIPEGWFYDEETGRLGGGGFGSPVGGYRSFPLPLGAVLSRHRLAEVVPIVDSDSRNDDGSGYDYGSDGPCIASGATNGFGDLTRWSSIEDDDWLDIPNQLPYADWSPGRWAWRLELIERLEVPVREYPVPVDDAGCSTSYCFGATGAEMEQYPICKGCNYDGTRMVPVRGRPGIWHPEPALIEACGVTGG
jgi:hypothetical protein